MKEKADGITASTFWSRLWNSSENAELIADLDKDITRALERFQVPRTCSGCIPADEDQIGAVIALEMQTTGLLNAADKAALDTMPRADANYHSVILEGKGDWLPGTRVELLDAIMAWALEPVAGAVKPIYVLSGEAGTCTEFTRLITDNIRYREVDHCVRDCEAPGRRGIARRIVLLSPRQ